MESPNPLDPIAAVAAEPDEAEALAAFARRDRDYGGRFVVAVTSTGVFCRPSCPARRPRAEHIRILPDAAATLADGYRSCRRCLPDDLSREARAVAAALVAMQRRGGAGSRDELAAECGHSPDHLRRRFVRAMGRSTAAHGRTLRSAQAGEALARSGRVIETMCEAGYAAPSRSMTI